MSTSLYLIEPKDKLIIFTHGVGEYGAMYEKVAAKFNQAGYSFIAYDQVGHGNYSKVGKATLVEMEALLETVYQQYQNQYKKIFLMGHSMGAILTNLFATTHKTAGLISIGYQYEFIPAIKWLGRLMPFKKLHLNWRDPKSRHFKTEEEMTDPLLLKWVNFKLLYETLQKGNQSLHKQIHDLTMPVLVIQGGSDKIVLQHNAEKFYKALTTKDKDIIIYPNSYHDILFDVDQEIVIKDIILWLDTK